MIWHYLNHVYYYQTWYSAIKSSLSLSKLWKTCHALQNHNQILPDSCIILWKSSLILLIILHCNIQITTSVMGLKYGNIKTIHNIIKIMQVIDKILYGIFIISKGINQIFSGPIKTYLLLPKSNKVLSKIKLATKKT